jgi:hypothetical protein
VTTFFDGPREDRTILPGKLTFGRPTNGDDEPYVAIQLTDTRSGARFVEVRLSYADLMATLLGFSEMHVEFAVQALDRVGMRREQKSEIVHISERGVDFDARYVEAVRAAQPFEVNGWRYAGPRSESMSWSQGQWRSKHDGVAEVRLPFIRFVPFTEHADEPAVEPDRADGDTPTNPPVRHRRRKPDET